MKTLKRQEMVRERLVEREAMPFFLDFGDSDMRTLHF